MDAFFPSLTIAGSSVPVTVTHLASTVDSFISASNINGGKAFVGLDVEWNSVEPNPRPSLLQLCIDGKCLIVQLLFLDSIPQSLANFLSNSNLTFVGVGITGDVEKLKGIGLTCASNFVELAPLVAKIRGFPFLSRVRVSLVELARAVLELSVEKNAAVARSDWTKKELTTDQIRYAATDSCLCQFIGAKMLVLYGC